MSFCLSVNFYFVWCCLHLQQACENAEQAVSELEEKVEGQSREMEALQTQNDDLNSLVKVSPVASAGWLGLLVNR